ncbi:MAG: GtrA family protein [Candidatus Buchananbacteria bacterium]|nr:GtrA family protein [Candidatus Buchananbacteria bacterium]
MIWFNFLRQKIVSQPLVKELIKFSIVGSTSALINFLVLIFLTEILAVWYLVSSIFGFIISALFNFSLNKIWTFRNDQGGKDIFFQANKYLLVVSISLIFNTIILFGLTDYLNFDYRFSWFLASILVALWNFTLNRWWTFKKVS